jgi:hypothetical protein
MGAKGILEKIGEKGWDPERLADSVIERPELLAELFEGLKAPQARVKYGCEKLLRRVSERQPELLYPRFEVFEALLDGENTFLKWGAIQTLANLARVDLQGRIDKLFKKYFTPVRGPDMITAANVIGGGARIGAARPELADRIARQILQVETAEYLLHGIPSPECRNVAIGHAIDALCRLFDSLKRKEPVIEFVRRQLGNPRQAVRKKAERFLHLHAPGDASPVKHAR